MPARIEALADPGGVFISRSVRDQIAGKCDFPLEDMGEHEVKNFPKPVHVFRVVADASAKPEKRSAPAKGKKKKLWPVVVAAVAVIAVLGAVIVNWFEVSEKSMKVEPASASSEAPSNEVLPLTNELSALSTLIRQYHPTPSCGG